MSLTRLALFVPVLFLSISLKAQVTDTAATPPVLKTILYDNELNKSAQQILSRPARKQEDAVMQQFVDSFLKIATLVKHENDSVEQTIKKSTGKLEIKGTIKDRNTGEGIPFAMVYFPRTQVAVPTEMNGSFSLTYNQAPRDSICVRAQGYKDYCRPINKNAYVQTFDIELLRSENMLREVVVHPGEDPAITLVKNIIKHKKENNPDKFVNYRYELYNKLELDLVRLSKEQFEKIPMMKPFAFIYNNVDSLSEEKPFLPIYLTETLSDYYFQRSPKKMKEFIKANQLKGIKNESITQFLGGMYQSINVYDNFIPVFDKQFVSPINNNAIFYYKYKIKDTQYAYGQRILLVQFAPKRAGENCFIGDFWVADSMFAIQRISMDISKDANINLVNRVSLYQEFAPIKDSLWFNVKDKFIADFTVPYGGKKLPGFIGRKTTSYKSVLVNDTSVTNMVNDKSLKQDVIIADDARNKDAAYWNSVRHDSLNKNEKAIYATIDSLNSMPIFIRTKNTISFLAKGTKEIGWFEFGPYWSMYNSNPFEGRRFRFSMGTTPKLFKDVYLNGYLAYGTLDERFKYKLAGLWLIRRNPRHRIYASYTSDLDRSLSYYSEAASDNLLSNFVRKNYLPWKLAFVKAARFEHYKEYFNGFSHEVTALYKEFTPYAPLPSTTIFKDENGLPTDHVNNTEVSVKFRYAFKERFLSGNYLRLSLGSKYPIVSVRFAAGLKNILSSGYEYQKLSIDIWDYVKVPHLGSITYNIFAGKYFGGALPYPLLEIHPGNDYYYYNQYAFSMMNRYEFISDQYVGLMFEHNIGGGVFNYIPLLKKAKFRQFWTLKTAMGSLSKENEALNLNKGFAFNTLHGNPYVELGTGIDNIFQLFRIDFVWRVTPTALPTEPKEKVFGIFGSFHVGF